MVTGMNALWGSELENDTVMNFIPIPIPTELKVDKVNIMLIKS